jgi:hypothetical protein
LKIDFRSTSGRSGSKTLVSKEPKTTTRCRWTPELEAAWVRFGSFYVYLPVCIQKHANFYDTKKSLLLRKHLTKLLGALAGAKGARGKIFDWLALKTHKNTVG